MIGPCDLLAKVAGGQMKGNSRPSSAEPANRWVPVAIGREGLQSRRVGCVRHCHCCQCDLKGFNAIKVAVNRSTATTPTSAVTRQLPAHILPAKSTMGDIANEQLNKGTTELILASSAHSISDDEQSLQLSLSPQNQQQQIKPIRISQHEQQQSQLQEKRKRQTEYQKIQKQDLHLALIAIENFTKLINRCATSSEKFINSPNTKTSMVHQLLPVCILLLLSSGPIGCLGQNNHFTYGQQQGQLDASPNQLLLDHRFKYHLNHLRPPSLVPITIQQQQQVANGAYSNDPTLTFVEPASAEHQHQQVAANRWPTTTIARDLGSNLRQTTSPTTTDGSGRQPALEPPRGRHQRHSGQGAEGGPEREQLVQLQVPLQLHLKLRPLPLPMPPPPPPQPANADRRSGGQFNDDNYAPTNDDSFGGGEKRKRSLESAPLLLNELPGTVTTTEATTPTMPLTAAGSLKVRDNELERNDQLMFAWKEAKRVLLLNSMSPALAQAGKLERRVADLRATGPLANSRRDLASQGRNFGPEVALPTKTANLEGTIQVKFGKEEEFESRNFHEKPARELAAPKLPFEAALEPAKWHAVEPIQQQVNRPNQRHQLLATTTPKPPEMLDSNDNSATTQAEVRRQRHSSQQLQGEHNNPVPTTTVKPEVNDARMQAMAAAMLPLVWPSFHLTGANQQHQWQQASPITGSDAGMQSQAASAAWPMRYTQLSRPDRQQHQLAAHQAQTRPMIADYINATSPITTSANLVDLRAPTTTTTTPTTTQSPVTWSLEQTATVDHFMLDSMVEQSPKVRSKRRKPSYLSQAFASSTPYPDSTRLASKYPMPKIKFRASEQQPPSGQQQQPQQNTEPGAIIAAKRPLPLVMAGEASVSRLKQAEIGKQITNLPESLSKLIEQQLLANATSLLLRHKSQVGGLPPTTSTSRVVRLVRGNTTTQFYQKSDQKVPPKRDSKDLMHSLRRHSSARVHMHTMAPPVIGGQPTTSTASPPPHSITPAQVTSTASVSVVTTTTTTTTSRPPEVVGSTTTRRPRGASPASKAAESAAMETTMGLPTRTSQEPTISATVSSTRMPDVATTSTTTSTIAPKKRPMGRKRSSGQQVRDQALDEQAAGSNKILPEDEPVLASRGNWTGPNVARKLASKASGIKLFHFKRKPDMNKLPFYKRPLNYTELGWTPEQIQEHQEAWRRAVEAAGGDGSDPEQGGSVAAVILGDGADGREKRKRRGKNHFDRLMGELHSTGSTAENSKEDDDQEDRATARPTTDDGDQDDAVVTQSSNVHSNKQQPNGTPATTPSGEGADEDEERVPVMKKKAEPLVLRPMFSVMNQKRRLPGSGAPSGSESGSSAAQAAPLSPSSRAEEAPNHKQVAQPGDGSEGELASGGSQNASRPVVRLRRKHHGEVPMISHNYMTNDEPWRPSRPLLWGQNGADRLLLVPTGILTPSGSHLVPVLGGNNNLRAAESVEDRNRLAQDLLAWRPARQQQSMEPFQQWRPTASDARKPSDGLAPNGEESFLKAPMPNYASNQMEPQLMAAANQQADSISQMNMSPINQQQQQSFNGSELKVPRLLVKPMRPAKYSLNGYIPKPSLGQQLQQPLRAPGKPKWPPGSRNNAGPQQQQQAAGSHLPTAANGKDLDSSTSNEVFSRRRGLQQHQRSTQAKSQLSFNSLVGNTSPSQQDTTAPTKQQLLHPVTGEPVSQIELNAHLRQLEENKRKYLAQSSPAKSPTLSAQKANLIKAKLGLIVTQAATTNSSTASKATDGLVGELPADGQSTAYLQQASDAVATFKAKGGQQPADQIPMAGLTPSSAIPKTDFECTDSKGRFVAGLFADHKTGCQVWHLCSNNRKYSFLCPSGTIFSAKLRICDWKYNVKCENTLPQ